MEAALPSGPTMRWRDWAREGLRAGLFLRPRVAGQAPTPPQFIAVLLAAIALEIALGRLEVGGEATFAVRHWLAPWWGVAATVLLVWALLYRLPPDPSRPAGLASWMALWMLATLPPSVVSQLLAMAQEHGWLPEAVAQSVAFATVTYVLLWAWLIGIALRLGFHFGMRRDHLVGLAMGLAAIYAVSVTEFPERPWMAPPAETAEVPPAYPLTQQNLEAQLATLPRATESLLAERPGVVDVYGLVFSPYAGENVFLNENQLVADVLQQRFEAQGRVLRLANHPDTLTTLPWATPHNLRRALEALASRMDRERDVLVVYLTSHGAQNFQLAADHGPIQVETLSPTQLRTALDEVGIRHRVVAISACFSGGWVGPLASEHTLVMTAASATQTSYGCGRLSELTFFGRAMFGEQLRKTHSFEAAFRAAVPLIREREVAAGKPDGFSDPQISVGEKIRPVLEALAQRLDAAAKP